MGVSWVAAASMSPEISRRPVAAQIEREFSGVVAWYGTATEAWWAMVRVRGGLRLVEAAGPSELREAIVNARGWSWPR
ncbi:hypothetical protein AB0H37_22325 [Actinomadura sp. NPDC023710]|uniref:hypothetical protein n=1 Tax=Actinomadura sp. NPDC023710 TaxID=3158219 RepID=UPI0033D65C43